MTDKLCGVEGCTRTHSARGLCGTHYQRWARTGSVHLVPFQRTECEVPGCTAPAHCRRMCNAHYQRFMTLGRLTLEPTPSLPERVVQNVDKDATGCWLWQGRPGQNGYGRISVDGKLLYAHRVSYELHVGPIPEGLTIDHLCRIRLCINPEHLEPVTRAENTRRQMAALRSRAA